jgi:HTH-type transcriptional regulator / antitoxin HigA
MSATISEEYLDLSNRFPLRPIRDERTLDAASDIFSELVMKGENRSTDENDYIDVLGTLIREYEEKNLPAVEK